MDGFTVRRPTPADADTVARLVSAYDAAFGIEGGTPAAEIVDEWASVDLDRDAWLAESDGGDAAAYAAVEREQTGVMRSDGYVHPSFAGRGLGTLLLALTEERARGLAALEEHAGPVVVHNTTLLADVPARALLEEAGYRAVNWSYRMAIDLETEPEHPAWPQGISVRSLDPDRDLEAFHAAVSEAFAEHWGGSRSVERFQAAIAQPDFDPSLWFLAADGDEVAGTVECLDRGEHGYIRYLGVRAAWRGRGLGLALLRHGFLELFRRGHRRVMLGVDANNASGAVRLYEGVGMRVDFAAVTFEKELSPGCAAASP